MVDVLEAIAHGLVDELSPLLPDHELRVRRFVSRDQRNASRTFRMACFAASKFDRQSGRESRPLRAGTAWQVEAFAPGLPFLCVSLGGDECRLYMNPPDEEVVFLLADPSFPDDMLGVVRAVSKVHW